VEKRMSITTTEPNLDSKEKVIIATATIEKPLNSNKINTDSVSKQESKSADSQSNDTIINESLSDVYSVVYKNCKIGMESIRAIKPQVEDNALKNLFSKQYRGYETLSKEVELQATKDGSDLENPSIISKAMLWGGVMINTLTDKSTTKIAEIMIQGINMGIISLTRLQNNLQEERNDKLIVKLINQYHNNIEVLKAYL